MSKFPLSPLTLLAAAFLGPPLVVAAAAPPVTEEEAKKVLNTPWWPAGTEKNAESVGILSYGLVFMTAMMEVNDTLKATTKQELLDVRDIAQAGGASMRTLVDCLVNAPAHQAAEVRRSFEADLPSYARPALTVVEMPGEYEFCPTSVTCVAATETPLRLEAGSAYGVKARGLLYIQGLGSMSGLGGVQQETSDAIEDINELMLAAGSTGLSSLLDCIAFVRSLEDARAVRAALQAAGAEPALTIARAGLQEPHQHVLLKCVAAVPEAPGTVEHVQRFHTKDGLAVASERLIFTSGLLGKQANGTEAFDSLGRLLAAAGAELEDVVDCQFYIKDTDRVFDLFAGFQSIFNDQHPPAPARTELTSQLEGPANAVQAKCVAVRRSPPQGVGQQVVLV